MIDPSIRSYLNRRWINEMAPQDDVARAHHWSMSARASEVQDQGGGEVIDQPLCSRGGIDQPDTGQDGSAGSRWNGHVPDPERPHRVQFLIGSSLSR